MSDKASAWRCSLCGYVHRGAAPPECCPVCGAAAEDFEPYQEVVAEPPSADIDEWHCLNCSYLHEGATPPDACPVCGVEADRFEGVPAAEGVPTAASAIRALIAGGGIAGVSAAEAIREASPESAITVISQEPCEPYYRLNLTRYLAGEIRRTELPIHPPSWYAERNIEVVTGHRIVDLSVDGQDVTLDDGQSLSYDRLILAMGSHPFVPPIRGTDLQGVFTLRTAADADAILAGLSQGASCVCIGGGILGLETAGALARCGGDVTLLESHEWLMPRQLNEIAASILEAHMAGIGVTLRKQARTRELVGSDGRVTHVTLQDGERIPCGMVIICTGVRPNTYLARKAGLEVDQGIVVDNHLKTSAPNIYAAGDVAEHNGVVYGVWGPSQYQGTIAGLNALGIDTPFGGVPRSNALKVLGVDMLSVGEFTPRDGSYQVVQAHEGRVLRHFVFRDGKMVGCILVGDTESASRVKKAIEHGRKDFSSILASSPTCEDILAAL